MPLPSTLPTAISRSPRRAAITDVATSGSEVPAATMVRPITSGLTPSIVAKVVAASTSQREPSTSIARPTTISASCTGSRDSSPGAFDSSASLTSEGAAFLPCR